MVYATKKAGFEFFSLGSAIPLIYLSDSVIIYTPHSTLSML